MMFDDFNDDRFFRIGRQSRRHGYRRRVTFTGDILPDQYTALRFCGFDEVLILANSSTSGVVVLDNALSRGGVPDPVSAKQEPFNLTGPSQ